MALLNHNQNKFSSGNTHTRFPGLEIDAGTEWEPPEPELVNPVIKKLSVLISSKISSKTNLVTKL
jgi:hypothetical protein